jgi:hypothetical protein
VSATIELKGNAFNEIKLDGNWQLMECVIWCVYFGNVLDNHVTCAPFNECSPKLKAPIISHTLLN